MVHIKQTIRTQKGTVIAERVVHLDITEKELELPINQVGIINMEDDFLNSYCEVKTTQITEKEAHKFI